MTDTETTMNSSQLVIGNNAAQTIQSTSTTWPNTWDWPYPYRQPRQWIYPTTTIHTPPQEEYANEVEVDQDEHDATLRFYRSRANGRRTLVKEVTVPIGVLKWLQAKDDDDGSDAS